MPTSGQVYPTSKTSPGKIQSNCFVLSKEQSAKSKMRAEKSEAKEKAKEKVIKGSNSHTTPGLVRNRICVEAQLTPLSMDLMGRCFLDFTGRRHKDLNV